MFIKGLKTLTRLFMYFISLLITHDDSSSYRRITCLCILACLLAKAMGGVDQIFSVDLFFLNRDGKMWRQSVILADFPTTWCRRTAIFNFLHRVYITNQSKNDFPWDHFSIISDLETKTQCISLTGIWQCIEELDTWSTCTGHRLTVTDCYILN